MPCDKVKYANKKMAEDDIVRIRKKSTRSTIPIRSYQCTICPGKPWHLTSRINFEERIKELESELEILKTERDFLRSANEELLKLTAGDNPEEHRLARIKAKAIGKHDDNLIRLTNTNLRLEKSITSLRKSNSELIAQVVQLNKKLEERNERSI